MVKNKSCAECRREVFRVLSSMKKFPIEGKDVYEVDGLELFAIKQSALKAMTKKRGRQ